jgi:hypothetical protein
MLRMPRYRMPRYRTAGLVLAAMLSIASMATAQSPTDSATHHDSGSTRAWLSLGLGGGNSRLGSIATRVAASLAVNPVVLFTLEGNGVGGIYEGLSSIDVMAGVRSPAPNEFFFLSAGLANVSCGSGCPNQTGFAIDGGWHIGGRYAGVGLAGFVVRAPGGSNLSGVVGSLDLGSFGQPHAIKRVR